MQQAMSEQQILERTRDYIVQNFLYARTDVELAPGDALLEQGIVDSMGMLELLTFVQEEFGIEPADEEIVEDNFATLERIARFVAGKRGPLVA